MKIDFYQSPKKSTQNSKSPFNYDFIIKVVVLLTFISLICCFFLSIFCKEMSLSQQKLFDACLNIFKYGCFAFIILIVGKKPGRNTIL